MLGGRYVPAKVIRVVKNDKLWLDNQYKRALGFKQLAHPQWTRDRSRLNNHRVDSVIESSLREIIGSQNFAIVNLSLCFCETTIYDNKLFLENLVAVHYLYVKLLRIF